MPSGKASWGPVVVFHANDGAGVALLAKGSQAEPLSYLPRGPWPQVSNVALEFRVR